MSENKFLEFLEVLGEIVQKTYFRLNPLNPTNSEDNYQELLRENLNLRLGLRVDSEISYQKGCLNILGDNILLKNRTERLDLVIRGLDCIMEIKCVDKLELVHENQLLSYLNNLDYKYGILINFGKSKSMRRCVGHCKVYERYENIIKKDKYGEEYKVWKYKLLREIYTEDYNELLGGSLLI